MIMKDQLNLNTNHDNKLKFYHDALILMTDKLAVQYMKDKWYFKHWIKPELNVNQGLKGGDFPPGYCVDLGFCMSF